MGNQWADSNRRRELPANWAKIRARVLKRDGGLCVKCGASANQVDHIGRSDNHRTENLQSLCFRCHQKKTAAKSVAIRKARAAARFRPEEPHPGAYQ